MTETNHDLTMASHEAMTCPFDTYDAMREQSPAYLDAATGMFVVTRYDDLREVMGNPAVFSNKFGIAAMRTGVSEQIDQMNEEAGIHHAEVLVTSDPPRHKSHRTMVDKVFSSRRVREMEPAISHLIDELIAAFPEGPFDFHDHFAMLLPMRIIADQLGLPRDRYDDFKRWSDASVDTADPSRSPEKQLEDARTTIEMRSFFIKEINKARENPSDNLLSALANAENDDGETLTPNELSLLLQVVLAAGNETTTHALGSAVLRLAQDPELQTNLRDGPDMIPTFIEEVLRLDAPLQGLFRRATQDTRIGDVPIPAEAMINIRFGAGNRDPEQFPFPANLDMERGRTNHLTFGFGIHHCIGSQLARAEMRIAIEKLLDGSKEIRLEDVSDAILRRPHFLAYGPRKLMLEFDRA